MAQTENDANYFINAIYILDDESNDEETDSEETDSEETDSEEIYNNILLGDREYQDFINIMSCIGITIIFEIGLIVYISQYFF